MVRPLASSGRAGRSPFGGASRSLVGDLVEVVHGLGDHGVGVHRVLRWVRAPLGEGHG
jgi:hypothetical protein